MQHTIKQFGLKIIFTKDILRHNIKQHLSHLKYPTAYNKWGRTKVWRADKCSDGQGGPRG